MTPLIEITFSTNSITNTIIAVSVAAFFGLLIGRIQVKGIGIGIGGVMFAGLALSALGVNVDKEILEFLRDFGLVLFVYMIGLHVGPSLAGAFKLNGLKLCAYACSATLIGTLLAALFVLLGWVRMETAVGILSGATTNTPALGAAKEALASLANASSFSDPTLGYAIAYPFGIAGTIVSIVFARVFFKTSPQQAEAKLIELRRQTEKKIASLSLIVENPNLEGIAIDQIPAESDLGIVIARFMRDGLVTLPSADIRLKMGDVLKAVGEESALKAFTLIVGREIEVDLKDLKSELTTKDLIVTSPKAIGKPLDALLHELPIQIQVTRVRRGDVEFTASHGIVLQLGDRVRVVGDSEAIKLLGSRFGDRPKDLAHFQFFPIFVGLAVGVFIGGIPISIPGLASPLKLGMAGGPLLASLFFSRYANHSRYSTYVPYGANLALRELGIILFLSSVGLKAVKQFLSVLTSSEGVTWLAMGASITLIPLLIIMAWASRPSQEVNYLTFTGLCAGSMTDPPALAFANGLAPNANAQAVGYATVYPIVMLLRILLAQALILILASIHHAS